MRGLRVSVGDRSEEEDLTICIIPTTEISLHVDPYIDLSSSIKSI